MNTKIFDQGLDPDQIRTKPDWKGSKKKSKFDKIMPKLGINHVLTSKTPNLSTLLKHQ